MQFVQSTQEINHPEIGLHTNQRRDLKLIHRQGLTIFAVVWFVVPVGPTVPHLMEQGTRKPRIFNIKGIVANKNPFALGGSNQDMGAPIVDIGNTADSLPSKAPSWAT